MRAMAFICLLLTATAASANDRSPLIPEPNSLFMRVVDTGSGTATITIVTSLSPGHRHVMIYDGGHWNDDRLIIDELTHYLGLGAPIDLLIISHSDSDHLGAADSIVDYWEVAKSVRTGWERGEGVGTYWAFRRALERSVAERGTEDFVMAAGEPAFGDTWQLGDATVTFLAGFGALPDGWDVGVRPSDSRHESKARNAVSIVVRVDYNERAILLPGDAVGRHDDEPWDQVIGTDKFLLDNAADRPLRADILLAPHHGADNASSLALIREVNPSWVIFSAGAPHKHPKFNTFKRYEAVDVPIRQMLRTDRGDERGRPTEWWGDWDDSCRDGHGDDGISILIRGTDGAVIVDQDPPADAALGC